MSANNVSVTYNGSEISSSIPIKQGMTVRMVHSLAGEDLQVDEARITTIAGTAEGELLDFDAELLQDAEDETLLATESASAVDFVPQAPVVISYGDNPMGKYYAREQKKVSARNSELIAYSAIWLLKLKVQPERVYAYNSETVAEVIPELMGDIAYEIDPALGDVALHGKIPAGTSYSQLFEILLVTGGNCTVNTEGTILFGYPSSTVSSVIDGSRLISGGVVETKTPLTYLSVSAYSFKAAEPEAKYSTSRITSLTVSAGKTERAVLGVAYENITLSTSSSSIVPPSSGWSFFVEYSSYSDGTTRTHIPVTNNTSSSGTIYIWGKRKDKAAVPEQITETVYSFGTEPTGIDTDNAKMISGHQLITNEEAPELLNRLWELYSKTETIKADIICNGEKPGDVVKIMRPDTKEMVIATIKSAEYKFGLLEYRASIEAIIGYKPYSREFEYTQTLLLTSRSGSFTVSELSDIAGYEVKTIRAVLVSSGQIGRSGSSGGNVYCAPQMDYSYETRLATEFNTYKEYYTSYTSLSFAGPDIPGAGGSGGYGGVSGLINDVLISVIQQSESFDYSIFNRGYSDGETKLRNYSSANGKRYTEPMEIAGYYFGGAGDEGISGASGGLPGEPGQSLVINGEIYSGGDPIPVLSETDSITVRKYKTNADGRITDPYSFTYAELDPEFEIRCINVGGCGASGADGTEKPPSPVLRLGGNDISHDTRYLYGDKSWQGPITSSVKHVSNLAARTPPKETQYGKGGRGGYGGGGAGAFSQFDFTISADNNFGYGPDDKNNWCVSYGSSGGLGGEGGDGCILLLF